MGDRANIIVISDDGKVCLYTHWGGSELPETLQKAMVRGKGRWDDPQYLARIIFCEMVGPDDWSGETGYGISQRLGDGGGQVIVVDTDRQTVQIRDKEPVSFAEYAEGGGTWDDEQTP